MKYSEYKNYCTKRLIPVVSEEVFDTYKDKYNNSWELLIKLASIAG